MAKKSITKNYMYNLFYQILILVLPLITTPYVSRVLGAERIGIYSYTTAIVSYFILFGELGVSLYGKREIAYAQENINKRTRTFVELILFRFITLGISVAVYYFAFINHTDYGVYYKILLIQLIATAFDISWFFQGLEEFKKTVTRNVIVRIISVTLVFILVKNQSDLIKYMLIYTIADLIGNLSLWIYLPRYIKGANIKKIHVSRHLGPIVLLFIPQIANQIYNMLDKTMIGNIISDKSEVGYYEQGQKIIRILLTIVTSLGFVMIPRMASTFASGDKAKVNDYMKKSFNFVFLLGFPIMFGLISVSSRFVPIFFGSGYDKVIILINIISPIILLMGISNVIGTQYLLPTKKQKEYTISVTIGIIVNFILNSILINLWDSVGASIATVLSQLVVVGMQFKYIKNEINLMKIRKLSYKYFFASLIMFGVCSIIGLIVNNGVTGIAIQVIAGAIVYLGILLILKDKFLYLFINKIKAKVNAH